MEAADLYVRSLLRGDVSDPVTQQENMEVVFAQDHQSPYKMMKRAYRYCDCVRRSDNADEKWVDGDLL